jgi:lysophospholipase L1-like esterase
VLIASSQRAPEGPINRLLSAPLLVAVGKRSYSLYLWHWPVVAATRPDVDVALHGFGLLLLRLALTGVLAEVSYRYVETPLRRGEWSVPRPSVGSSAPSRLRLYASAAAALVLTTFSTRALIAAQEPALEELTLAAPAHAALHAGSTAGNVPNVTQLGRSSTGALVSTEDLPHVLAIGDSVMLGARKFLRSGDAQVEVDAEVGRTPLTTLSLLKRRKAGGALGDVVIIHLGNNGPFQPEQFDRMVELLADVPHVAFVTAKVPRRLGVFNNRTIRDGVERHPRTVLIDWFEASKDHANWFRDDGLHLRESGATEYARLLAQHYLPEVPRPVSAPR